ncbi:MAG: type II toxin-antitoxin system HicB family antitoxin [Acidobacteria bacterium]|nr:type II toxin-antitoxin system HicB family antitoxin [Acidobacteriota bacterium]
MTNNKYSFQVTWSEEDQVYFASCPEFPGLLADGKTPSEALAEAQIALQGIIEVHLEDGDPLPEPITRQNYSGQFRVRIPKSLHRRTAEIAVRDGVSLNAFVLSAIAEKVGAENQKQETATRPITIVNVVGSPSSNSGIPMRRPESDLLAVKRPSQIKDN